MPKKEVVSAEGKPYSELPHEKLSELIRRKREEHALKSGHLARQTGLTRSAISQVERGKLRVPHARLAEFVDFYQISRDELGAIDEGFLGALDNAPSVVGRKANDPEITKEDLAWLLNLYEGLAKPMTISQITGLLKCRH